MKKKKTCIANAYTAKTQHSLCSYTQNDSNVFTHELQLIYITHIYTAKARLSFCAHTHLCDAVNRLISIFWSIYMRHKYIHCKNMTQSLLIYIERQQRLCTCAATNIRHSHSHCKGTTQLLRTYTSMQRSKSIDFSIFWSIYMRCKYSHCEDTTQLLHIYMLMWCSKSIDFSLYQIDLHALQIHRSKLI